MESKKKLHNLRTETKQKTMENLRTQFNELVHKAQLDIMEKAPFDLRDKFKGQYEDEEDLLFDLPYMDFSDSSGNYRIHTVIVRVDKNGNVICKGTGEEFGEEFIGHFDDVPAHSLFYLHELINQ